MKNKILLALVLITSSFLLVGCQNRNNQPDVNIIYSVSPNGGGDIEANYESFKLNDGVILTAIPKEGYIFKNWTEDGNEINTSEEYKFRALNDRNIVANFVESYDLEIILDPSDDAGSIEANNAYEKNTEVTITAQSNYGYQFVKWLDEEGNEISKHESYTFNINKDRTLTAVFEKVTPTETSQIVTFIVIVVLIAGGIALTIGLKKKRKTTTNQNTPE